GRGPHRHTARQDADRGRSGHDRARRRRRDARAVGVHARSRNARTKEPRSERRGGRTRDGRRHAADPRNDQSCHPRRGFRRRDKLAMYERYYGFDEKPFSLTPDPKYLYRSQSHADAFDLLQYAVRRREGFVVITGDIGTGKTTLCRALLEQIEGKTFTALVLNPFLSEDDLLKRILLDFGVISR